MSKRDEQMSSTNKHEDCVDLWRHFTPHSLVFLTSLTTDDGLFDQASVSAMADSSTAALGTMISASAINTNYTRLRCLRREKDLSSYDEVFLSKAIFRAFDCTLTGEAEQDAGTLAAIEASLTSDNDAYMQSRFRFGEIGGWQPNYFSPSIRLRSKLNRNILAGYEFSNFSSSVQNAGDLSVGATLPYLFEPRFPVPMGKIPDDAKSEIIIHARAAQYVDGALQPYPILCELELLGYKRSEAK